MYWLKQCTKCGGDLASDYDQYGHFVSCLQCGLCEDIQVEAAGSPIVDLEPVQLAGAEVLSREGYRISVLRDLSGRLSISVPA